LPSLWPLKRSFQRRRDQLAHRPYMIGNAKLHCRRDVVRFMDATEIVPSRIEIRRRDMVL
jgi:hypothetical protein